MKEFDLVGVMSIMAYWDTMCATKEDLRSRLEAYGGQDKAHDSLAKFLSGLDMKATRALTVDYQLWIDKNAVITDEADDPDRLITVDERIGLETMRQKRLAVATSFGAEASKHLFVCLERSRLAFWDDTWPVPEWEEICNTFPSASDHIKLGRQCYVLEQPTACVYHFCCAVEMGIRSLPKKFPGITPPNDGQATWGRWRNSISNYANLNPHPKFWRELNSIIEKLTSMEKGVRNQVMHPHCEVSDKDAKLVMDATHGILEDIASFKGKRIR